MTPVGTYQLVYVHIQTRIQPWTLFEHPGKREEAPETTAFAQ